MPEQVAITVNDQPVQTTTECSVAAAIAQGQGPALRRSVTGQPRGPLCGMGVCFECRVTIDDMPHQRSCQTLCQPGMRIGSPTSSESSPRRETAPAAETKEYDVLIVGAGPGGLAAAASAAQAGRRVALVDDNPHAGGQIWRHDPAKPPPKSAALKLAAARHPSIQFLSATQILGALDGSTLLAASPTGPLALRYPHLILASGARERFLPFPGWTLPGVFGAGGLQALVKAGYPIAKQRVVVAGSGPLLLAVAAYLRQRGADVRLIAEQAPRWNLVRFAGSLLVSQRRKLVEALGLGWTLRGIPLRTHCWPIRADGSDRLASVTLTDGARTWTEPCDALACGFGLVPNLELPLLIGCALRDGFVTVNNEQQTSLPNVYAIGEITGIGGLDKALIEGQIAGSVAAGRTDGLPNLQRQRAKTLAFVAQLAKTFALRAELRQLADKETIVCRCEDVTLGQLLRHANWRDAKLQTRCGMGPCQGRICGPSLEFLFGWTTDSVRPPIFPTALGNLAVAANS